VGLEDLLGAQEERFDGAPAAGTAWACEPGECGAGQGAAAGRSARPYAARAEGCPGGGWHYGQPGSSLAGAARSGLPAQKKSIHAAERDTEANRARRVAFLERLREIPPERLIFLDETGVTTSMTRLYARCRGGRRIAEATPRRPLEDPDPDRRDPAARYVRTDDGRSGYRCRHLPRLCRPGAVPGVEDPGWRVWQMLKQSELVRSDGQQRKNRG